MSEDIRVVLADDHTLVRQSVSKLLNASEGMQVVGEASNGSQAVDLVRAHHPDVAVLDISMPEMDGLEAAEKIRIDPGGVKILMLTMHDDDTTLRRATEAAVDGYVAKTASTDEVVEAVRTVAGDGAYVSPAIAMRMMRLASSSQPADTLTEREVEILRYLSQGFRIQDIAKTLFLSPKTVKNHLTNVYAKLDVQTAAQAVADAYRRGIVSVG